MTLARRFSLLLALCLCPAAALGQVLVSTGSNSGLRLWSSAGNDWWLDPSQGRLDIRANGGSPAASFLSGGNVGIGTTNPGAALGVSGNATVSGTLTASGMSKLRAHLTNSPSISDNTQTFVVFLAVDFDALGEYNSTTGKITVAQDGYYWVHAKIAWFGGPSGNRVLFMFKNGSLGNNGNAWIQDITGTDQDTSSAQTTEATSQISTFQHLSAGDVLDVRGQQSSGGALQIGGGTEQCYVEMFRVP